MINKIAKMKMALFLLLGMGVMQSCEKDILSGQPEWLGNSIYETLQNGIQTSDGQTRSFNYTLRLIDDLGLGQSFSQTDSKTIFVCPDDVYEKWFTNNDWNVRSYEQLSEAQKKLLLNNSVVKNPYLLELMTDVAGNPPKENLCMRRETSSSILDTIYTISPEEMPAKDPLLNERIDTWAKYRDNGITIKVFKDNTSAPMIHFMKDFMVNKGINGTDLDVLTNHQTNDINQAWIDGKMVLDVNNGAAAGSDPKVTTCKNGYIYVVNGVIEASDNMAEIIRKQDDTKTWSKLINRFSVPVEAPVADQKLYNDEYGGNEKIYVLRYFSDNSQGRKLNVTPDNLIVNATLSFDPGWNHYMYTNSQGYDLHYDAGAMLVPKDDVLNSWFETSPLKEEYGSWEKVPPLTLSKLLNVNMLPSFTEAVPSKFHTIVDDAKMSMNVTPADIDRVVMGCNGVVYITNKVFAPAVYRSVVFPALTYQSKMSAIYYAIDTYEYGPYLNSMESQFAVLLPYNTSKPTRKPSDVGEPVPVLRYLAPYTYGQPKQMVYEFYYDTEGSEAKVKAKKFIGNIDATTGKFVYEGTASIMEEATDAEIKSLFSDMVNNFIIVGNVNASQRYYLTRAGSIMEYVDGKFRTGYMLDKNIAPIQPSEADTYGKSKNVENGTAYGVNPTDNDGDNACIYLTSPKSVYQILKENASFSKFFDYLAENGMDATVREQMDKTGELQSLLSASSSGASCAGVDGTNYNISTFDNFNYTVYVPSNVAIQNAINDGILPTFDDVKKQNTKAEREFVMKRILSFVRYHLQDNSIIYEGEPTDGEIKYETAKMDRRDKVENPDGTNRYFPVFVKNSTTGITVRGRYGTTCNVDRTTVDANTGKPCYNLFSREYWFKNKPSGTETTQLKVLEKKPEIYSSSNAVVHLIDGYLKYENTTWVDAFKAIFGHDPVVLP